MRSLRGKHLTDLMRSPSENAIFQIHRRSANEALILMIREIENSD